MLSLRKQVFALPSEEMFGRAAHHISSYMVTCCASQSGLRPDTRYKLVVDSDHGISIKTCNEERSADTNPRNGNGEIRA